MRSGAPTAALLALLVGFVPARATAAEEEEDRDDEIEQLELLFDRQEVVVSATRAETTVQVAPSIVSVVTAQQIRRSGARSLVDVLRLVPGIETSLDTLGLPRVAVRGKRSSPQLLVLVDGIRMNDVYEGSAPVDLPAGVIERVEVIRGPGSALYGSDAFAGVVNVLTRRGRGQEAYAWGGSYATGGAEVVAGVGDRTRVQVHASAERTDGPRFPVEQDALSTSAQGLAGPDGRTSAWAQGVTAGLSLARRSAVRENDRLALDVFGLHRESGPYLGPFDTLTEDGSVRRDWAAFSLSWDAPWSASFESSARLYAVQTGVRRDLDLYPDGYSTGDRDADGSPEVFPDGYRRLERTTGRTLGLETRLRAKAGGDAITAGVQVEVLSLPSYELLSNEQNGAYRGPELANYNSVPYAQEGRDRLVAGVFVQDERRITSTLGLTLGLRHDHYGDFGGSTNPRAALVWTPGEIWTAKLLFGTAFRAPTFRELYDRTEQNVPGAFVGNPDLQPERIRTVETGLEARPRLLGHPLTLRANVFYDEVRELIAEVPTAGTVSPLRNAGDVNSVGAEVEGRWALDDRTWLFANGSWFRAADLASRTWITDVPQWRANAGFFVGPVSWLNVFAVWQAGGERRNNARTTLERIHAFRIERYDVVHVTVSTEPLWRHLVLAASVQNALDQRVVDDVPRPDRMPGDLPVSERTFLLRAGWVL